MGKHIYMLTCAWKLPVATFENTVANNVILDASKMAKYGKFLGDVVGRPKK